MNCRMIKIKVAEVLAEQGKSLYWLAKESGVPYTTLVRWRKAGADSVHLEVLEKICRALGCGVEDVLVMVDE
jgi:putative transcriptional regulator